MRCWDRKSMRLWKLNIFCHVDFGREASKRFICLDLQCICLRLNSSETWFCFILSRMLSYRVLDSMAPDSLLDNLTITTATDVEDEMLMGGHVAGDNESDKGDVAEAAEVADDSDEGTLVLG